MARRTAHLLATSLLASSILFVAACGSGGSEDAPATATVPPSTGCTTTPPPRGTPVVSAATPAPTPEPTASTGGAARSGLALIEFVRQSGGSVCLPSEVLPRGEFAIGLSGRYELDERGMLFYFARPHRGSFWMKNTHVDLSIAFVSADSRIVEIREMKAESEEFVTPAVDFRFAIEAQPGWYARNGIAVGDEVRFAFTLPAGLADQE